MELVINGFNLADSQPLSRVAGREHFQPFNCERKLLPSMGFLFTGRAAFRKLEEFVEEFAKSAEDSLDIVVVLLPQNVAIREIRYTEANTIFLCDDHDTDKFKAISIRNGHPFKAAVDIVPRRGQTRLVTEFTDQSYPVPGLVL